jgi:hypothetical protein
MVNLIVMKGTNLTANKNLTVKTYTVISIMPK